ncbi:MAG: mechanosensitive ion channel, partial [Rhodospirillaceae bacterium]|nr:mechanosensitive ion channel [Rhodospirillaceae bacterium]
AAAASAGSRLDVTIANAQTRLARLVDTLPRIREVPAHLSRWLADAADRATLLRVLLLVIATYAGGYVIERFVDARVRRKLAQPGAVTVHPQIARFDAQCGRLISDVTRMAVFAMAAFASAFLLWQGLEPFRSLFISLTIIVVAVRFTDFIIRFVLLPGASGDQLIALDAAFAPKLIRELTIVLCALAALFFGNQILDLSGFAQPVIASLNLVAGGIVVLMFARIVLVSRRPVAAVIGGGGEAGLTRRVIGSIWHLVALAYLAFAYGGALLAAPESAAGGAAFMTSAVLTVVIVLAVPFFDAFFGAMVEAWKFTGSDIDPDGPGPRRSLLDVVHRIMRVAVVIGAVALVAKVWNIDLLASTENTIGDSFAAAALSIGITVLLAYTLWLIVEVTLGRYDVDDTADAHVDAGGEGGGAGASRVETVMPLIRRFFQVTIVVISAMIILSSLGMNIGPLIAGAGVVGLAIGFGAQTLVTDVISGLFYLLDDAFRTGEYVDIGDVKGRVEKMNVRSLVLRHHRGALNTVPYSEIKHLKNYSRDWVIMKLMFRVTYDTDVNQVKKIFKKIGQDLLEDPVLGEGFIEPFKSQGVLSMEDSAMIVRGKFMTKPGEQFMIRKEIYNRVQKAFDEAGIKFAHRRVLVDMAETESEEDRADTASAVGAAAATATAASD